MTSLVYKFQNGFTLLELVLVLFILAIITATSLSFIETEDGQIRYDSSIKKRDAVVDSLYQETIEGSQKILSGYVVENGRLPPIHPTDDDSEERIRYWLFDNTFEVYQSVNAYSNTDGTPELLTDGVNNFPLFKGYRSGAYLIADNRNSVTAGSAYEYKDGWGVDLSISNIDNPTANDITIGYDGDGVIVGGGPDQFLKPVPFNNDNDIVFSEDNWTIDRGQLHIIFTTNDTGCVNPGTPCDYTISISVFRNNTTCGTTLPDTPANCWDTYYYTLAGLFNGDSHDTLVDPFAWSFNGSGTVTRVPVGEHLAVVLDSAGDATALASARFKVFPNSTQPTVTLTVP